MHILRMAPRTGKKGLKMFNAPRDSSPWRFLINFLQLAFMISIYPGTRWAGVGAEEKHSLVGLNSEPVASKQFPVGLNVCLDKRPSRLINLLLFSFWATQRTPQFITTAAYFRSWWAATMVPWSEYLYTYLHWNTSYSLSVFAAETSPCVLVYSI